MNSLEDTPVVSVLMPVFNAGRHLEPAVRSILNQDFSDFELVIIDDASTDGSDRVVESIDDPRIRVIRNEVNLGVVGALNRGLFRCRGRFIARMDADDLAHPQRLAVQVAFMEANPDIALCGSDIHILCEFETDRCTTSWVVPGGTDLLRFRMMFDNPFCHPTVMLRSAVLRNHGIDYRSDCPHAEDFDFWRRIAQVADIANLENKLLTYRIHAAQVSETHAATQSASVERVRHRVRRDLLPWSPPFDDRIAPLLFTAAWDPVEPGWQDVRRKLATISEFGGLRFVLELVCWAVCARFSLFMKRGSANVPLARFLTRVAVCAIIRSTWLIPGRMIRRRAEAV